MFKRSCTSRQTSIDSKIILIRARFHIYQRANQNNITSGFLLFFFFCYFMTIGIRIRSKKLNRTSDPLSTALKYCLHLITFESGIYTEIMATFRALRNDPF